MQSLGNRLATDFLFLDKKATGKTKDGNSHHKRKTLVGRPAIRPAHDLGHCRVQFLDEVQTLAHTLDNLINVLVIVQ